MRTVTAVQRRIAIFWRRAAPALFCLAGGACAFSGAEISVPQAERGPYLRIAAGGGDGLYYETAKRICAAYERAVAALPKKTCKALDTAGSVENLRLLREGEADFAVTQSDRQFIAYHGALLFGKEGPMKELRSVASLHTEFFLAAARAGEEAASFADMAGKRIDAGHAGSSARAATETVMALYGIKAEIAPSDSGENADPQEAAQARIARLCGGETDILTAVAGETSPFIQKLKDGCGIKFLKTSGDALRDLAARTPFYVTDRLPAGIAGDEAEAGAGFGMTATLVTRDDQDEAAVRAVYCALAAAGIDITGVAGKEGNTAPVHEALEEGECV